MFPVIIGLSHRTAPVEILERVSISTNRITPSIQELRRLPEIQGVALLSTCNRLEIYASTMDVEACVSSVRAFLARNTRLEEQELSQYISIHTLYSAVRHLFRVASGLDSMVLGETQILGQVAKAYEIAYSAETTNKVINVLFQNALAVGKRVRCETLIDQHPTSISSTAVELARQVSGNLGDKSILILGVGEMGSTIVKHFAANGAVSVMVTSRSSKCAEKLAAEVYAFQEISTCLEKADIVLSATASPHFVLGSELMEDVMKKREYKPILLIDIAVPRDIDPLIKDIQGVTLYDIDDIRGVVDRHQDARELAAQKAEAIVEEEMACFVKWHNSLMVIPTIKALQEKGEEIKSAQLKKAFAKLDGLTPKQQKIIISMVNSVVNQLLGPPMANLKEFTNTSQGHIYIELLQDLFGLDVQEESRCVLDMAGSRRACGKVYEFRG